jgi:hypothetical protein
MQNDIHMKRVPGARKKLEEWSKERVKLIDEILAVSSLLTTFTNSF